VKNKVGTTIQKAFEDICQADGRKPERLRTDNGKEFFNKNVRDMLKERDIHHFTTHSDKKANYAERLIRTVRSKIAKYMYDNQTFRYIDVLQQFADSYNATVHSAIKVAPSSITKDNELEFYMKHYMPTVNKRSQEKYSHSFAVGQAVRISLNKGPFTKSYNENFSEAIYKIKSLIPSHPPRYEVEDLLGKQLRGSFYEEELVKVVDFDPQKKSYKIEKIVERKGNKVLVRWYGYDHNHDTWLNAKDVKNYKAAGKTEQKRRRWKKSK